MTVGAAGGGWVAALPTIGLVAGTAIGGLNGWLTAKHFKDGNPSIWDKVSAVGIGLATAVTGAALLMGHRPGALGAGLVAGNLAGVGATMVFYDPPAKKQAHKDEGPKEPKRTPVEDVADTPREHLPPEPPEGSPGSPPPPPSYSTPGAPAPSPQAPGTPPTSDWPTGPGGSAPGGDLPPEPPGETPGAPAPPTMPPLPEDAAPQPTVPRDPAWLDRILEEMQRQTAAPTAGGGPVPNPAPQLPPATDLPYGG